MGERGGAVAGQLAQLLAGRRRSLETVLEGGRVPGEVPLQGGEGVEPDGERHPDQHHPAHLSEPWAVLAEHPHPPHELGPGERHHEERHRHPDAEGDREEDRRQADLVGGPDDRDGRQDRAGARDEHETEAEADDEPPGPAARLAAPEAPEGALEERGERRDEIPEPHRHEERNAGVAQEVLGQVKGRDRLGADQDEQAEAQHEPGHHGQGAGPGPPPARGFGVGRRPGREDHGQHRHNAGRDPGDEAGKESDADEPDHRGRRYWRSGRKPGRGAVPPLSQTPRSR